MPIINAKNKYKNNLKIAPGCTIHATAIINVGKGEIIIRKNTGIGDYCVLYGGKTGILIGENVAIAAHCVLANGNHNYKNKKTNMKNSSGISDGAIIIENNVWIGAMCVITDNVTIHRGAVVGAGSVVTKDIPKNEVWVGNPAKKIGER